MGDTGQVANLIDAASLHALLPDVTVLDVRWRLGGRPGRPDHLAGHVPGAAYLDIDTELCGPPGAAGRHPLPDPEVLQRALRAAGVRDDRPVVVYDDGDGLPAARTWWTLRWAGHGDVRVLDGGFAAWTAADLPQRAGQETVAPGDVTVSPGHMPVLDADGAAEQGRSGLLLDARQAPRYRGETEPIDAVAGHIPGARNVPYADLVGDDGRLHAPDRLRARFAEAGAVRGTTPAAYCGSGITAAHTALALAEAGFGDAPLYVGSWSNWTADPSRPIGVGDENPGAGDSGLGAGARTGTAGGTA